MIRCGGCKHWRPPESLPVVYDERGSVVPQSYGRCGVIVHLHKKRESAEPPVARVCDSEEYSAWFETNPEFGCILGESS